MYCIAVQIICRAVGKISQISSKSTAKNENKVVKHQCLLKLRKMRWAGHVAPIAERRSVCMILVGKPEGKRPLGRPRRRWEDYIKMDLEEE